MLISNSRKIEPVKTSVQLWWYSKEKCIVYNVSHRRIQVWRYLNKNTIYFFKKHYVQLKRKQVLQSTGYAGCKNTCIGHEISLRKISEPLALKALDFTINSTTTRNAVVEARCGTYTDGKGAQEPRGFQLPHLRAGFPSLPRQPRQACPRTLPERIWSQSSHIHTSRRYFQDTNLQLFYKNGRSIRIFWIQKIGTVMDILFKENRIKRLAQTITT